jgi:2,4-dienoyl-CoA reductase-like NADH-dependent reductase (Old Yellow Enzyme family)
MMGIYKDDLIEGYRQMTERIHERGSRVALQILHCGLLANSKLTGQPPMAASVVEGFAPPPIHEMTTGDIQDLIEAYGLAALRALKAGFDAVQIHAAHGYMGSQFLSPAFNKRQDAYGGSVENRARFLVEVLRKMRASVGKDYPIMVKMNSEDFLPGGLTLKDSVQIGRLLQEEGVDGIELSGGTVVSAETTEQTVCQRGITSEEKEAYFRQAGKVFKEKISVPLILVGGIRSFQVAEKLIKEKYADYISMSRPFIREPGLINRWQSGDMRRATCLSDNQCYRANAAGEPLHCVVEQREKGRN